MPNLVCEFCKTKSPYYKDEDVWQCGTCGVEQPTGYESKIRKQIEAVRDKIKIPRMTVGRAIGFASAIYEFSTHNDRIDSFGIESRLEKKTGMKTGMESSSIRMISTRSNGGLVDQRVGLMIFIVGGRMEGRSWNTAFVVFRGSRGNVGGSAENPKNAGWDDSTGTSHNLDWAANFTNNLVPAPWFPTVKVHQGFLQIYSSVGQQIRDEVEKLHNRTPNLQVVCTGHSLGAALATLCAHDLEHTCAGVRPFCYPFCPPKTGNLAFARNFDLNISSKMVLIDAEPGRGVFSRGISFVQSTDPVSWGGGHGFKLIRPKKIQAIADSGNTLKQGIFSARQKTSKTAIFYLAPNVYNVSFLGFHSYFKMEQELLGKRAS